MSTVRMWHTLTFTRIKFMKYPFSIECLFLIKTLYHYSIFSISIVAFAAIFCIGLILFFSCISEYSFRYLYLHSSTSLIFSNRPFLHSSWLIK